MHKNIIIVTLSFIPLHLDLSSPCLPSLSPLLISPYPCNSYYYYCGFCFLRRSYSTSAKKSVLHITLPVLKVIKCINLFHVLNKYVYMYICWQLPNNQSFYREIVGYGASVGDHRVAR